MGLFTGLLTLPIAPARGVVRLAELLRDQAERELYDPALIRRKLTRIEEARQAGELTDDEAAEMESALLERLMAGRSRGAET